MTTQRIDRDDPRVRAVWQALDGVTDPELDEPVTALGFIEAIAIDDDAAVTVEFRLPTYWCSPNFAYLMADDMRRAVIALDWVSGVRPVLHEHMEAERLNDGVARGLSFDETFGDLADGQSLDALRLTFRRKAFQRRQEVLLRALRAAGVSKSALVSMTLAALTETALDAAGEEAKARYLAIRRAFAAPDTAAPAFLLIDGTPLTLDGFDAHLDALRGTRLNMEFNGALCRGLLEARARRRAADQSDTTTPAPSH